MRKGSAPELSPADTSKRASVSPAPKTSAADVNVGLLVRYTFRSFTRILQVVAEAQGISAAEFRVMRSLEGGGALTQAQIAAHAAMDRPYAALIVKQLRAKVLVEAKPDPKDRRRVDIQLSDRGVQITRMIDRQLSLANQLALEGLPSTDVETFLEVMSHIRSRLEGVDPGLLLGEQRERLGEVASSAPRRRLDL